jgi:2-hydroxychromene-2-carboxylate isomerase
MATAVDFYFDFRSPYSYLANTQLRSIGVEPRYRPMDVLAVMQQVGNTPTTVVCAAKGRYARADLQRWASRYNVTFQRPKDPKAIDARRLLRAVLKAAEGGQDGRVVDAIFAARWARGVDLGTLEDLAKVLTAAGIDPGPVVSVVDDDGLDQQLTKATRAAGELGVFGAPTFVAAGEMFFGNDRLDFLREHLEKTK